MDYAAILVAANSLSREDRIRLVDAIWESIEAERGTAELSGQFKQELDRRAAAYEANPEKALPWEVVRARVLARWERTDTEQKGLDATLIRRLEEIQSGNEAGVSEEEFLTRLEKELP